MLLRLIAVWLLFGFTVNALGGGASVIPAGIAAVLINRAWRQQEELAADRRHHEQVIADENLRLEVRERRVKP